MQALEFLKHEGCALESLSFLHVNAGVSSMDELTAWVRMFVQYREQFQSKVVWVYWPLKRKSYELAAAQEIVELANEFSRMLDEDAFDKSGGLETRIREFLSLGNTRWALLENLRHKRGYKRRDEGIRLGWADEL